LPFVALWSYHAVSPRSVVEEVSTMTRIGDTASTASTPQEGGLAEPPSDDGVKEPPGDGGVKEPPVGADGVKEPPGADAVKEPPGSDGVKEPPGAVTAAAAAGAGKHAGRCGLGPDRAGTHGLLDRRWRRALAALVFYALLSFTRLEVFKMLLTSFFPLLVLILAVLGSIVMGLATPTEAAAVGAWAASCWRWPTGS
jgi:TRAP-type mannitol/chloroaromatic compound transport system permease large subunit